MFMMDEKTYDVPITQLDLSTNFLMKYQEKIPGKGLVYELDSIFYNQSITFGVGGKNSDLMQLWQDLSSITENKDISHNVKVKLPTGDLNFTMYPSNFKIQLIRDTQDQTLWSGLQVNFTAEQAVGQR